jgi:NAD(P)-dependent dehydrogenase (short-subunit alcohol dehydrogenase family)
MMMQIFFLFVGATASLRGAAGQSSFGMGKSALRSLAQTLSAEGAPKGTFDIRVSVF